jgi:hypothetical protein
VIERGNERCRDLGIEEMRERGNAREWQRDRGREREGEREGETEEEERGDREFG